MEHWTGESIYFTQDWEEINLSVRAILYDGQCGVEAKSSMTLKSNVALH